MAQVKVVLLLFLALAVAAAARPLASSSSSSSNSNSNSSSSSSSPNATSFEQAAPLPRQATLLPLTERVYFDPNNGEDNKIEDYIANFYIGEVDLAEADPAIAASGIGVNGGVQFQYQSGSYFDYENPTSSANIGPGAKAIAAAVGRVLGLTTSKAAARGAADANLVYTRDAYKGNKVTLGTATQLTGGASGGLYVDRGADNTDLLEAPTATNFIFG